jgi:hypothetical protein
MRLRILFLGLAGPTLVATTAGVAQTPSTLSGGPPVQVVPYAPEPGVPLITISPGTANPFAGSTDPSGGSAGSGPSDGSSDGTAPGGTGVGGPVLNTLLNQSWGNTAVSEASSLGVNATALAAMCTMESQCTNIPNASGGSATGPFQMLPSTFTAMYQAALQANPSLAATTTGSINDPASQAAAAAEYMAQIAQQEQAAGISNPTLTDVRAGYGFGNAYAVQIATALQNNPSAPLGSILSGWSSSTYAANGLTPTTTVAQWAAGISSKIGTAAANQPVLGS